MSDTVEQLNQYLELIQYPKALHPPEPLKLLENLQIHQLSRVPFESTGLHYSQSRLLSLDPDNLF